MKYTFHIGAYKPETMPMSRLAEYMSGLAALLGNRNAVHFDRLEAGSTRVIARVAHEDVPKVQTRLACLKRGEGDIDAEKARAELDKLLAGDNASGALSEGDDHGAEIIRFPGIDRPKPVCFGPFNQDGTLDGVLIGIGGADQTVHVRLQNGDLNYSGIETDRDTARRLARHMYEPVRIAGTGRWFRDEDGKWELRKFRLMSFEVLQADDLRDVVEQLRALRGANWTDLDDPLARLASLRGKDELH